ncbi:dTMP kinase [Ignavibacterium sp.]|uniref:dTMP kinase n=1 Tax=Ignavibacterium sp. TaxID=2651167 RepID=UPI00220850B1|nr:dTMP kinase [Ignavibacterium sp.]BDQ01701.1 MAG: thymidylate kinase [Ignavibacterium sp.]
MFITFEGIDFCGKSTQVELLKNYFERKGKSVKVIREPGGTEISEKIRDLLLDKKNNKMFMETELLLFSASRAQLVREKIVPFIQEGSVVISDRFHDSSTAYQGFGRGLPIEAVLNVHKLAIGDTIPDITFIIDIPVSVAVKRKAEKTHQELDRIEVSSNDFFEKVRNGYLTLAKNEKRFRIIDGTKSIEEIHKLIINYIEELERS